MTQPTARYRKTPKTPFLAGNILLVAFGVSLVFFGPEPWSVSTVLLVVLCLAIGGLLTLLPFLLDQFALLNFNRSCADQAGVTLRQAVKRADEILAELREREVEDNPLRLVSERLPDLVEEKLGEAIRRGQETADSKREEILKLMAALQTLPKDIEKAHDDLRTVSAHAATREFVETGLSNLSKAIYRLELQLEDARRLRLFGGETESSSSGEKGMQASGEDPEEKIQLNTEVATEKVAFSESEAEDAKQDQPHQNSVDATNSSDQKKPQEKTTDTQTGDLDGEEKEPPQTSASKKPRKPKTTKVIVSAFVGIQNGIYLRGSDPGLPWNEGARLEMTGIGEWVWTGEPEESLTGELYLNDKIPSDIGPFTIKPGDVLKLNPSFPAENKV